MYKHDHSQFSRPTECNNKICTSRASVIAMTTNLLPSLCMSLQGLAKVERLTSRRTSLVYSLLNWRPQMVNPNLPLCQLHLVKASHLETVHNWMSSLGILGHDCAVKRDINSVLNPSWVCGCTVRPNLCEPSATSSAVRAFLKRVTL
jgi:hypothetical protein